MEVQSHIDYADQLWMSLEQNHPFLKCENTGIQEKRKQLQRKEVIISAFGRHNCGKSTLLNFITRNLCLPTSENNETCIEIKIKHDRTVHPGICKQPCSGKCPQLVQEFAAHNTQVVAIGADAISETLRKQNAQWRDKRDSGIEQQSGRHFFVLYAYVPILEVAPAGWNLALVDTPGFGEANVDHITKHTDMLFSTSTAYLYLMDSTSMEDSIDGENIGLLFKHDKGIFQDGRLIVAINKYDVRLSQESLRHSRNLRSQSRPPQVSVANSIRTLQQSALDFIAKTVECHPPPRVEIVAVSAQWGDTALWLRANPDNQFEKKQARRTIEDYPDSQPQGQGGADMGPQEMSVALERMSRLLALEDKLRGMIRQCIHIWRISLANSYAGYLRKAKSSLQNHKQELEKERKRIKDQEALIERYNTKKGQITGLAYCEQGAKAEIETRLEQRYDDVDVEAAKRLLHGRIEEMVKTLIQVMKNNVERPRKPFLPRDFEQEVKRFLEEEAERTLNTEQLNMKLEGVAAVFRESLGEMEDLDREIEDIARQILPPNWTPQDDALRRERANRGSREEVLSDEVLQNQQLILKDLHERTKAPEIRIGIFKRIWNSVRKFFGKKVEEQAYA
jgi:predicted GTPase